MVRMTQPRIVSASRVIAAPAPTIFELIADPAEQKARSVAVLVKEFGMSEADAGALYDRVNPKVAEIAMTCQQEAMSKLQAPQQ